VDLVVFNHIDPYPRFEIAVADHPFQETEDESSVAHPPEAFGADIEIDHQAQGLRDE
jgi:hypothetical protein